MNGLPWNRQWIRYNQLLFMFLLLFLLLGSFADIFENFDSCSLDRNSPAFTEQNKGFWDSKQFSFWLFLFTQCNLYLIFIQVILKTVTVPISGENRSYINWELTFTIVYTIIWYVVSYFICIILKHALGDFSCHKHPNSVSGHVNYHVFYALSALYIILHSSYIPKKSLFHSFKKNGWILLSYGLFLVSSFATLWRTWSHGYHTPRQMLYGGLLGILSHFLLITLVYSGRRSSRMLLFFLGSVGIIATGIVYSFTTTALSFLEIVVVLGLVSFLIWIEVSKSKKVVLSL